MTTRDYRAHDSNQQAAEVESESDAEDGSFDEEVWFTQVCPYDVGIQIFLRKFRTNHPFTYL